MQKKALLFIIALLILLVPTIAFADAESIGSNDLIDRAKDYDGQTVVYEGEVIGDILYRGDYAWLAVFDGNNTIGCYVTTEQAKQISVVGGYGKSGDTVQIEGIFHRACAEHGGDLDIHCVSIRVLTIGETVVVSHSKLVMILACALPLPAAGLLFLVWKRRAKSSFQK
jgi:hypothetical protein